MRRLILFIISLFISIPYISYSVDCKKHIELLPAEVYAKELDSDVMSVLSSYKIYLWQKETSKGKGRPVGKMIPGSRAVIVAEGTEDYKVKSPLDNSV